MATLTVRNLGADLVRRLRIQAAENGRSAEAEHRAILWAVLVDREPPIPQQPLVNLVNREQPIPQPPPERKPLSRPERDRPPTHPR